MRNKYLLIILLAFLMIGCTIGVPVEYWLRYRPWNQYCFDGFFRIPETEYYCRVMDTTWQGKSIYISRDSALLRQNPYDSAVVRIGIENKKSGGIKLFAGDSIYLWDNCYAILDTCHLCADRTIEKVGPSELWDYNKTRHKRPGDFMLIAEGPYDNSFLYECKNGDGVNIRQDVKTKTFYEEFGPIRHSQKMIARRQERRDKKVYISPLSVPIAEDNMETFLRLLDEGVEINRLDKYKKTPLMCAVGYGRREMAQELIDRGADLERRSFLGVTPLWVAYEQKDYGMVRLLLESGANVNCKLRGSSETFQSLVTSEWSMLSDSAEFKKYLRAHGINYRLPEISWAIMIGDEELFRTCLAEGARINVADRLGYTPLFYACMFFRQDMAKELIRHGADVNARDDKLTPLLLKIYDGQNFSSNHEMTYEAIKLLLESGADMNARTPNGISFWTRFERKCKADLKDTPEFCQYMFDFAKVNPDDYQK